MAAMMYGHNGSITSKAVSITTVWLLLAQCGVLVYILINNNVQGAGLSDFANHSQVNK